MQGRPDWSVSVQWIVWTVAGAAVGMAVSDSLHSENAGNLAGVVAFLGLLVVGAFVGISQWHVLHNSMPRMPWVDWLGVTIIGVSAGWLLPLTIGWGLRHTPAVALFGAIGGAIYGYAQWHVLSRYVHGAAWWVAVTALAGSLMFLLNYMPDRYLPDQPLLRVDLIGIGAAALVTSPVLAWLISQAREIPQV